MSAAASDRPYTVVVGVSATSGSPAALTWAGAQARANGGRLVAVRVLKRNAAPAVPSSDGNKAVDPQAALAADVAEALGPDHGAECRVLYGGRRTSLLAVAVAETADLLVIDTAQASSSSSLLARRLISRAQCPVVVLPPAMTDEPPSGITRASRAVGQSALRAVGTSGRPGYRPPERP